jgi:hypothetical protein
MKVIKLNVMDGNQDIEVAVSNQSELDRLNAFIVEAKQSMIELEELREKIHAIGDYAHDNSTGPAVHDALWDIRSMCYELI